MLSNHLILSFPLLLLPSIFPNGRVSSNESALRMRWPKYWSFSFSISPSYKYSGLISFRMDWLVWSPCSPRNSQESSLAPQFESINSSALSLLYGPILTSVHDYWKNYVSVSHSGVSDSLQPHVLYSLPGSSMQFSRQENWSGQQFPSLGELSNLGIKPRSPALQVDSLSSEPPGKPRKTIVVTIWTFASKVISLS